MIMFQPCNLSPAVSTAVAPSMLQLSNLNTK
jgi:hypothetical protein